MYSPATDDEAAQAFHARMRQASTDFAAANCGLCMEPITTLRKRCLLPCCSHLTCCADCARRSFEGDLVDDPLCHGRQIPIGGKCPFCRREWQAAPEVLETLPDTAQQRHEELQAVQPMMQGAIGLPDESIQVHAAPAEDAVQPMIQGAIGLPDSFTRGRRGTFRLPTAQGGIRIMPAPLRIRMLPRRRLAAEMALDSGVDIADARNVRPAIEDAAIVAGNADEPREDETNGNAQMALVPASQAEDGAIILATQNGSEVPVYEDAEAGFAFQDLTRLATGAAALPDPLENVLQQIRDCRDMATFRALIHPEGLFEGLRNGDGTYATVRTWLSAIKADQRNHLELNATPYSIKKIMPVPFALAIQTVASAEGWPTEALAIAIASNVGWLEHHETRLKQKQSDEHSRGQNIPFFQGMDPSLRKSSLKTFTTQTCMRGANILPEIRNGTATCVDGTLKGHRNSLLNLNRSGIETDEITNAYQCSSGDARGMHHASREKVLGYVNGERDSVLTADGIVTLEGYSFAHRVWGQIEPMTKVLMPRGVAGTLGFPKRFALSFHQRCDTEPDQQCAASKKFLLDFHDWLGLRATPTKREPHFDNFALTMHFKTLQGGQHGNGLSTIGTLSRHLLTPARSTDVTVDRSWQVLAAVNSC